MPSDPRYALAVERSPWLRGALRVPGDAMVTQLALLAAAVARGETVITGSPASPATAATERAVAALGAHCERTGTGRIRVHGLGSGGLLEPAAPLDFAGSALGVAMTMGLAGSHDFTTTFTADPEVASLSYAPLLDRLTAFGVVVEASDRGRLPATLRGPRIAMPAELELPDAPAAMKAALLLAALNAHGTSVFVDRATSSSHAERMLRRFGAQIEVSDPDAGARRIAVAGYPELRAQAVEVPSDPSLAALGMVAAAIVPGSEISVDAVLLNPSRTASLSALMAMGAPIAVHNLRHDGEEEIGGLVGRHGPLKGIALAAQHVAPLVDDLPILAVAAAFAEGSSMFYLPAGLPLLERARLATLSRALAATGVPNELTDDAFAVAGRSAVPGGARLDPDDAGIALAMLVLGMAARERVTLGDASVIKERFAGFVEAFEAIGAGFVTGDARG